MRIDVSNARICHSEATSSPEKVLVMDKIFCEDRVTFVHGNWYGAMLVFPRNHYIWWNPHFSGIAKHSSSTWISYFVLVCLLNYLYLNSWAFTVLLFQFSISSHMGKWASSCVRFSCLPELNHNSGLTLKMPWLKVTVMSTLKNHKDGELYLMATTQSLSKWRDFSPFLQWV